MFEIKHENERSLSNNNLHKPASAGEKLEKVSGDVVRPLPPVQLLVNNFHDVALDDALHTLVPAKKVFRNYF
jgi:hypothetical protein